MKKFISIMLCIVMLLGVMSVMTFAEGAPDDAKALGEYGQKSYYIGDQVDTAPDTLDGVVSKGEYTLEILGMKPEDDGIDDRFFVVDGCDIEYINLYLAQDFDNIYVAVEVKDPSHVDREGVSFHIGVKENIDSALGFMARFNDVLHETEGDTPVTIDFYEYSKSEESPADDPIGFGDVIEHPAADAFNYVMAKGCSYNEETQIATFELAFSRLMLEEYAGDLFEDFFLRVVVPMMDETGKEIGTVWFGFRGDSAELREKHHCYISRFPHVFYLSDGEGDGEYVPVEQERDNSGLAQIDLIDKVATAPVIDGAIGEGEYTDTFGAEVAADTVDWNFIDGEQKMIRSADAAYAKGLRGASWSLAADEEYLYVAASIKTSGAEPKAQFYITKRQDDVAYPLATISADGSVEKGTAKWDFTEVKTANDGENYVFEGKIAIDDITDDNSKIYVMSRAYLDEGFILFGLVEDRFSSIPCGFRTALAEVQTPVETEPAETDPVETDPVDTDPVDTDPAETDPIDTPADTTPESEPAAEGGCGGSIAAVAVALIATLGTCTVFVNKRR